jgi:hypothetical protein
VKGFVGMELEYEFGGDEVRTSLMGNPFADRVTWGPRGEICLKKRNLKDPYEINTVRTLRERGKVLHIVSRFSLILAHPGCSPWSWAVDCHRYTGLWVV